jgi:DNA repair ATPase RecN
VLEPDSEFWNCRKEPMVRFAVDHNISLALQQNPSQLRNIRRSETLRNLNKMRSANDQILNQITNVQADLTKANNKLETLLEEYNVETQNLDSLLSCIKRP